MTNPCSFNWLSTAHWGGDWHRKWWTRTHFVFVRPVVLSVLVPVTFLGGGGDFTSSVWFVTETNTKLSQYHARNNKTLSFIPLPDNTSLILSIPVSHKCCDGNTGTETLTELLPCLCCHLHHHWRPTWHCETKQTHPMTACTYFTVHLHI